MGVRLVGEALAAPWAHLTPRARLVLVAMAYKALDQDTKRHRARVYFAGHEQLRIAIFEDDGDTRTRANQLRLLRRDLAELREHGAIEVEEPAIGRRSATYRINTDAWANLDPDN